MEDVAPRLIEAVTEDFHSAYEKSGKIQNLLDKVKKGTATYAEAQEYSLEVSRLIGQAYEKNVSSAVLPDGRMYYNIAQRLIPSTLDENFALVSDYSASVQKGLNEKAKIGLKPQTADKEQDRIDGIVDMVSNADVYDEVAEQLLSAVENFSQHIVDETIRKNVEFHHKVGLSPKIIRKAHGKCCAWCRQLVGEYDYLELYDRNDPREIYRRHSNCRCTVLYDPADGSKKMQNVFTKRWTDKKHYARLKTKAMAQPQRAKSNYDEKRSLKQGFEAFPTGDRLKSYIRNVKPDGDFFDVAMHGTPSAVCFGTNTVSMDARELARIIMRDPNYRNKQSVRLLSCSTGVQPPDGSYCVAEQLANILGVQVKAPDDVLNIRPDGSFYVGYWGTGDFQTFKPNQRRRVK